MGRWPRVKVMGLLTEIVQGQTYTRTKAGDSREPDSREPDIAIGGVGHGS